jgi:hypothetical protein
LAASETTPEECSGSVRSCRALFLEPWQTVAAASATRAISAALAAFETASEERSGHHSDLPRAALGAVAHCFGSFGSSGDFGRVGSLRHHAREALGAAFGAALRCSRSRGALVRQLRQLGPFRPLRQPSKLRPRSDRGSVRNCHALFSEPWRAVSAASADQAISVFSAACETASKERSGQRSELPRAVLGAVARCCDSFCSSSSFGCFNSLPSHVRGAL